MSIYKSKHPVASRWSRAACLLVLTAGSLQAQMWVRDSTVQPESLTGASSGDGRARNLTLTTAAYAGVEYNDNITLLSRDGDGSLGVRGGVNVSLRVPVSMRNELHFDASVERLIYLTGNLESESYNSLLPGSETTFTVYAGPLRIRNFIRAELTEDPVATPVVNNVARFGRFNGYAGSQVDWDMNRVIWQLTGSLGRQFATEGLNSQIDYWSYGAGLRAVFPLGPAASIGLSHSQALIRYDEPIQNDSRTRAYGLFGHLAPTRRIRIDGAVGFQGSDYQTTGSIADRDDYNGLYGSLGFSHQIRRNLSYSFEARHDISEGYGTNFYETTDARFAAKLSALHRWEIVGSTGWQWISVSGVGGDDFERLNLMLEARRPLGEKLDLSAGASMHFKMSDRVDADYSQRRLYASLRYTF